MSQVTSSGFHEEMERRKLFLAEVALRQWVAEYYSTYQPARGEAIDVIIECVCDLLHLPRPHQAFGAALEELAPQMTLADYPADQSIKAPAARSLEASAGG